MFFALQASRFFQLSMDDIKKNSLPIQRGKQIITIDRLPDASSSMRNRVTGSLENVCRNEKPSPTNEMNNGRVSLEREMEASVETLFRDWDGTGSRHRVRPSSVNRERPKQRTRPKIGGSIGRLEVPELDAIRRDERFNLDSSDESIVEEPLCRPQYSSVEDSATTGGTAKLFRIEFEAEGFDRDDIAVTLQRGSRLEVIARREETDGGRKSTSEFSRRIKLPNNVDCRRLQCALVDGKILLEAPLLPRPTPHLISGSLRSKCSSPFNAPGSPPSVTSPRSPEPLNVPVVKDQDGLKIMSLCVEIGRVFRSEDVVVKVRNPSNVLITAERSETNDCSRLAASLTREFNLRELRIASQTLKAGMTVDGLLKISAQLLHQNTPADDQLK